MCFDNVYLLVKVRVHEGSGQGSLDRSRRAADGGGVGGAEYESVDVLPGVVASVSLESCQLMFTLNHRTVPSAKLRSGLPALTEVPGLVSVRFLL